MSDARRRAGDRERTVREALREWDEARGGREPSAGQVARMRATLLAAHAESERATHAGEERAADPWWRSRPALAWAGALGAAAVLALLLAGGMARRAARTAAPAPEAVTAEAPAPERPATPEGAPAPEEEEPAPPEPVRDRVVQASRPSAEEDPAPDGLAATRGELAPPAARAALDRVDSTRRIRRLDFQTGSGRKIHWILDSEFRGVGR